MAGAYRARRSSSPSCDSCRPICAPRLRSSRPHLQAQAAQIRRGPGSPASKKAHNAWQSPGKFEGFALASPALRADFKGPALAGLNQAYGLFGTDHAVTPCRFRFVETLVRDLKKRVVIRCIA